MDTRLLTRTLDRRHEAGPPPVWLMRQAGRYHWHYQNLRKDHGFAELCQQPALAAEVALGPVADFDFDAAILFSDILFPLEQLGFSLTFADAPKLSPHFTHLTQIPDLCLHLPSALPPFQAQAIRLTRAQLPGEKSLLGFVGGIWTLFAYAVEGTHQAELAHARAGLVDGRFERFAPAAEDVLCSALGAQLNAGADAALVIDTAAGALSVDEFRVFALPGLRSLASRVKRACPEARLVYYSKGTGPAHWRLLRDTAFDGLGVDWHWDMAQVLDEFSERFSLQGNLDPHMLLSDSSSFHQYVDHSFAAINRLPRSKRSGWVCGLGHGVLPRTPEHHVRYLVRRAREVFV